ncbi:bifunctional metallophosphatase/5'-nucleotidase [Pseudonocardia cypriaca]|uniref:5'-nucleotidase n=1 Tax=Pseudonocardia cypriaca TaxID=882449 RepID=A0A543GBX3_9PSEU|nr:bifunctional metallophosphatase/5'-nucleotidase [Pseudonocardia cypriaca]TQM43559.1 5'-nucleotidase [Pseudonocardia cypriaca]
MPRWSVSRRTLLIVIGLAALAVVVAALVVPRANVARPPIDVQLLALNDFHGNLEPPSGSSGKIDEVDAGGAEYLATQLRLLAEQVQRPDTITVAAGDLIGASPLLSAAFHDEPAIEALGLAGLDLASVGNHEFDEGSDELLRIQNGGCHPQDGCADPARPYAGADFQYLSANAFVTATGEPLLPPYAIREVQGVRIGFIGMTLEGTPDIVTQSGIEGLAFRDEVETANRYAAELQEQGVQAIVVLLHEGGTQAGGGGINDCTNLTGPAVDIVGGFSDAIDVVVSGHTHQAYNCVLDGRVVTSASSFGRLVTDIDMRIDPSSGDVVEARARNVVVGRDVAPDAAQKDLIGHYRALLGPVAAEEVGETSAPITREAAPSGETPLGNLIADAQLAATDDEQGAVAAFMNPGGVRADLDAGPVTYEEAFTVQPFGNYITTLDLTGAQLDCLLEQQFVTERVLQPSATVRYVVRQAGTPGTGADPCAGTKVDGITIGGAPVDPAATYRITMNSFIAGGGDGFSVATQGANDFVGGADVDALTAYLGANRPVGPPATDRITLG